MTYGQTKDREAERRGKDSQTDRQTKKTDRETKRQKHTVTEAEAERNREKRQT